MKVAIVGGSKSSEHLAPFDDPEWEIWVHGNQMDRHTGRRVSRIFEIHNDLTEHDPEYPEWLSDMAQKAGADMIVGEGFPIQRDFISVFPFDAARKYFGRDMLSSTPAYMMSLALIEGADEIGIYGVDMAVDDNEYFMQQPVMFAWIGLAMGMGKKVHIPDQSSLMKATHTEGVQKKTYLGAFSPDQFLALANKHAFKIQELEAKIAAHEGSRQTCERLAKVARALESGQHVPSLIDSAVIR